MSGMRVLLLCAALAGCAAGALLVLLPESDPADTESPRPSAYVDPQGVGGPCSDSRSAAGARSRRTPWCSLERAVEAAPPDARVLVRRARLGDVELRARRRRDVALEAFPGERVEIASLSLDGARHVSVVGMTLGSVVVEPGTSSVVLERNVIRSPGTTAVTFSLDADDEPVRDVSILDNRFEAAGVDSIQAKNFRNLRIEGNEFTGLRSRDDGVHPDVLQTVFGGKGLVFSGNWLHDYEGQGVFVADGNVEDVVIESNRIDESAGSYSEVRVSDATGVRFTNNKVRGLTRFSGPTTGVVITDNTLDVLMLDRADGLQVDREERNVVGTR
jgi:Right handed beta helix region